MGKVNFLVKKIAGMKFRRFFEIVGKVHDKSGKNRFLTAWDIVYCGFHYGAGQTDYYQAGMYELNASQRRDLITSGVSNSIVAKFDDKAYMHFFQNKNEFNEKFAKYVNRDWLLVQSEADRDAFGKLTVGKEQLILKPMAGMGGSGVRKIPADPAVFDEVLESAPCMIEEIIVQVPEMAALNATSVNTVRPITFLRKDGTPVLLACFVRIGDGGVVDNFCSGGMAAPVNVETGVVEGPACNEEAEAFSVHPTSGEKIVGFQIPRFQELKAMVLEAAEIVPQIRYVGWDVAVTAGGPVLIEGNEYPAHGFYNFRAQHPDGGGMRHIVEERMGESID